MPAASALLLLAALRADAVVFQAVAPESSKESREKEPSFYERVARKKRVKLETQAEPPQPEERSGEPMIDLDEPPLLETTGAVYEISEARGEKRGLRTARLKEIGPVEQARRDALARQAAAAAAAAAQAAAAARAGAPRYENCERTPDLPKTQHYPVGCRIVFGDGGSDTLIGFDGSKELGKRHRWRRDMAGKTEEYLSSPLVFDLNGDGVRMSRRRYRIVDVDGDRRREDVNEISLKDGLLVLDLDRDGRFGEGGQELLGSATDLDVDGRPDGFLDGFQALKALAERAESRRLLPPGTAAKGELGFAALAALEAAFGLRMKIGGGNRPAVPLEKAGVIAISLPSGACERVKDFDGQGNETMRCAGASFRRPDGSSGVYEDVWFGFSL